jgi:PKD repeat protein
MKNLVQYLLAAVLLFTSSAGFTQKAKNILPKNGVNDQVDTRVDNMSYWMKQAGKGLTPYNPQIPLAPALFKGSQIRAHGVRTLNSPDIPVTNLTDVTESENSVFIDPNNTSYLLNSNNSTSWSGGSVGSLYGANYFQSANAGIGWAGSPNGAGGANSGDPTTAIGLNGRQYVNFIDDPGGQGIAYSDNGTTWSTATIAPNPGSLADKNHMWIDNKTGSPYEGNLYAAWTDFGGTDDTHIKISRSVDDGLTWSTGLKLSAAINAGSHNQGVNVQTGPNGEVYVAWAVYDGWPTDETAIGFAKSTNGGVSFPAATRIISNIKGIRTTAVSKNHRVNSFPVMAVDISGGPNNGNIYIVWTNVGTPGTNTGTNKSVYIIRSTNGGTSWSTPVRVNQGPNVNGKESYFPWISCDPVTGTLTVVFYDDRNVSSTQCEVFVAYSVDAGNNWVDFPVSDVAFTPAAIPGLAGGYMGDYLGITSKNKKVYPCWTDNRGGLYMTYVSPFELSLNAEFTSANTTICPGTGVTFTDLSIGPPTSWTWTFPGGTPGSYVGKTPPVITYSTPGTYDVSLTVTDGVTTDTETKTGYITVKNVIADFTGDPTTVIIGNTVTFTDNSGCTPATWAWSFPGGTPSSFNGQNPPAITYNTLGTYDVSLTVTKPGGTDTKTRAGYITVTLPIFNMTNGTITTCTGDFYDSGGSAGAYQNNETFVETFYPSTPGSMIRFNFSSFSTEAGYDTLTIYNGVNSSAPVIGKYHGTTSPGIVTASNASGALTFRFHSDVSATSTGWAATISCNSVTVPPVADFSASALSPPILQTVNFTDLSANVPTSWLWSFSPATVTFVGGTTATSQNPQVQFSAVGLYTVTLTATNAYGSDTEIKTDYISVTGPAYNMTNGVVTTCDGNFYDSGGPSGYYQNYETFVETFYPSTPGSMTRFTFTSFDTELGYDTLTIYNGINSSAPVIGKYHGSASPGTVTASNASGALTFRFYSDAYVTASGWSAAISCYNPSIPPVADFSASNLTPQVAETVMFTDLSANVPASWAWSFSPATVTYVGGTTSASQNPQVQFSALGFYTVTLTATNAYGFNTKIKTNYINVSNCTISTLPFTESFTNGSLPVCWTQTDHQGNGQTWQFGLISGYTPLPALTGNYAYLNSDAYGSGNTQNADLVSPPFNLSAYTGITLQFDHYFRSYTGSSGTLSYSLNNGTTWTQIQQFTATSATNPETFNQVIAALAGQPQVKFKWNYTGTWGWYWGIDNILVSGTCLSLQPVSVSIEASANPVYAGTTVTYTATAVNGGTTPGYQWKVNDVNVGSGNSSFDYVPADGDVVSCILTSGATCVSGNPATSNSITMTVTSVPAIQNVNNIIVTGSQCFNATQTIVVAGDEATFTVVNGGSATMIAGQNIIFNPGTTVLSGGYLHGYIAPGGPYCPGPTKASIVAGSKEQTVRPERPFFRIYPNPTTGEFTLALNGYVPAEKISVEIFNTKGEKIFSAEMADEMKHEFSLSGKPAGLYLVKVNSGSQSGSSRIVKVD